LYSLSIKATPSAESTEIDQVSAWLAARANRSTVREIIASEYKKRYQKWKNEYLSTSAGREQWERFALNQHFELTITVSRQQAHGAKVDFQWDDFGHLIAATIILGDKLDSGYPSAINYPITCSLSPGDLPPEVKGKILAATKLSHEFGHLNQVMSMDGRTYQLQNRLMLDYMRVFNGNGFNIHDPSLMVLAEQMGGTPVSISQNREHWAEAGALDYLQERLPKLNKRAKIPSAIKDAINAYQSTYGDRFQMF
jgi:YD repeat-containing protein